jgi:hypothetical protein
VDASWWAFCFCFLFGGFKSAMGVGSLGWVRASRVLWRAL